MVKICCVDSCIARLHVEQGEFSEESPLSSLTGFMRCVTGSTSGILLITEVDFEFPIRPTYSLYSLSRNDLQFYISIIHSTVKTFFAGCGGLTTEEALRHKYIFRGMAESWS